MLSSLTEQLKSGQGLTPDQVSSAVAWLTAESVTPEAKAEFLTALAKKGETVDEIAAFAREMRELSLKPPLDALLRNGEIIDVCGTGGDRLNTFNISTSVAILVAAAGVPMAKHGNRAITSKSGSADVLEALGIPVDNTPEQAAALLKEHNFAFFLATRFHPAFKHIGPARKLCAAAGQRTIFNFLGPLMNPARPTAQLIGVPNPALTEPMARVLQSLGIRRGMVVSGQVEGASLDELSTMGENRVAEFYQDQGFHTSTWKGDFLPLQPATLADLTGGDAKENAVIVCQVLSGQEKGPKRDAVLLNAAAALMLANKVKTLTEGWEFAAEVIDSGKAAAKIKALSTRS
ncbi:MAG TPA: anthranilate phosphoribosyltransferase [Verrucomicrobiae bacterium]